MAMDANHFALQETVSGHQQTKQKRGEG